MQQERGVYCLVTAVMAIRNSTLFCEGRTPVEVPRTPQKSKLGLKDNTDASEGEVGDHASLSSFHSDIGIPINFQEESGLFTFEALKSTSLSRCQEM